MSDVRWTWWMVVAAVVGTGELVLGIGNIVSLVDDDRRSVVSALAAFVAATSAASLAFGGLSIRRRNRAGGSALMALGMFPGCLAIMFFWFFPAVVVGLVCIAATASAVVDALGNRRSISPAA